MPTLYVNSSTGNDSNDGSQAAPFKTISQGLKKSSAGDTIQIASGSYTDASGEDFPLTVPYKVTLLGNESNKGSGIVISGGGEYISPVMARQSVAILLENEAQLRGVTVTNKSTRGTAVWIENGAPKIGNCSFVESNREGVFIAGSSKPIIEKSLFRENTGNGISLIGNAKGELRENVLEKTGYGINLSDQSAPLIIGNRMIENRTGMILQGESRPVLRQNTIEKNTDAGMIAISKSKPDLGSSSDPGENTFSSNGSYDLESTSSETIISIGNNLQPTRVKGSVEFQTAEVPVPEPTPSPTPSPAPTPTPAPSPTPSPEQPLPLPQPSPSGFTDIANHWGSAFIQAMVEKSIITGFPDGTFKPDESLTRAQYAAILAKAFNRSYIREATNFRDVASTFWGKDAIAKANRMGFLSGFPDGTFRPNDKLTRVQALVGLVNGLGLVGGNLNVLGYYGDRAQIPSYATDEVATATEKQIVVNYPNLTQLNPMRDITRSEVAALVYQALVSQAEASAIDSSHIVKETGVLPSVFSDVKSHWAEPFIMGLYNNGLINGFPDGTFNPDGKMTRAQYASLIAKAINPPEKRDGANFPDVPPDFWGYAAVQKSYKAGFLSGFPDYSFRPNQNIQKVQVLLSLVNGLGLSGGDASALNKYNDKGAIPGYAEDAVATATVKGLIVNYPNQAELDPNQDATRAEVSAMVYQALVDSGTLTAVNSDYIVSA